MQFKPPFPLLNKAVAISQVLILFFCNTLLAQQALSGKVTDINNVPLAGASVTIDGGKRSALSDIDGNFTIVAKQGELLKVSFVGYNSAAILIGQEMQITIVLEALTKALDDVVLIGYGTARKKDLTGAVSSVAEKNFNKGIFSSPEQLIQGKASGVQIVNNTGSPGGSFTFRIRGNSAIIGTGQPLYVIDGVPLDGRSMQEGTNPLNFLNATDIVSFDILKDASASAIYGSRAAYGVVIINTKKGQAGVPKLEVSMAVGASAAIKGPAVLNASEYREAIQYYGINNAVDKQHDTDGLASILQRGMQQQYTLAASGGNENGRYRISAGYLNQQGVIINTGFKRYNVDFTAGLKFLSSKKLGIDFHVNASQYVQYGSTLTIGNTDLVGTALRWNPTAPITNADGTIRLNADEGVNPVGFSNNLRDHLKANTVLSSITPYYKFNDWLEYKLLLSYNYNTAVSRFSINQDMSVYQFFPPLGLATIGNNEIGTLQLTQTLSANKQITKDLHLNAVGGYEYMKFSSKGFNLAGNGSQNGGFGNYGLDYTNYIQFSDPVSRSISSFSDPAYALQSVFLRSIFNFRERYLFTATFRADGSTKFGPNNRYGYFPSFAMAWNLSKEDFWHLDKVNTLKLRVGWGKTGNQEFPSGSSQALYGFQNNGSIVQINSPNPDLQWQSDRQYNFGVDFSMFNNRLSGTIDYFNKKTTKLLFPGPPIQPAPPSSVVRWVNLDGNIINSGVEILVNGVLLEQENIGWDISANATFLDNTVSGLSSAVGAGFIAGPIQTIRNGMPMFSFFTREYVGLDAATGYASYTDNGNSFYNVGNPNPKLLLGFSTNFRYRTFSIAANMYGSFGQDVYNKTLMDLNVNGINGANMALSEFRNPVKESFGNPVTPSSRYIQRGDYMKMANLTLSYTPVSMQKVLKDATVYLTGQNLFFITSYEGFDPEVSVQNRNDNGVAGMNIDQNRYPSSRTIILGIKFTL